MKDFDLDRIFGKEGVQIVHLSGPDRRAVARDQHVLPGAGPGREEARHPDLLRPQLPRVVLEGPRGGAARDLRRDRRHLRHPGRQRGGLPALPGHRGPGGRRQGAGGQDRRLQGDDRPGARRPIPNASVFATTLREVVSANRHLWGAIMADGRRTGTSSSRARSPCWTGSAAATVSSAACSTRILKGWEPEKWIQFGWASGALATTLPDRLRPARRRGAGLEHLAGQRPRPPLSGRHARPE